MAFDHSTAERIRCQLGSDPRFMEQTMFGGIGFLLYGNLCAGVWKDQLIVRVGHKSWENLLTEPDVSEFDITGRSMKGWLMIQPDGFDTDAQLQTWLQRAIEFTTTLPPK